MADVFVSYAREDSDFVRRLVESIRANEHDVWVDFDDIPFGSEWWQEVVEGIQNAATGIFVISPESIQSQYCSLEIAELLKHRKKFIPIVRHEASETQIEQLPQAIRDLNWIFFNDDASYDESITHLIETIDTDLDATKAHTKLLLRALEWQDRAHSNDLLLRGDELASFIPMLERDDLTAIQRAFVEESLTAAQARYNFWRFVFGFLGGFLAMAFYTFVSFRANQISPLQIVLSLAVGEIFGVFSGIIAVFSASLPTFVKKRLSPELHLPIQIAVCLVSGMATWITFQWLFLNLPLIPTWASFWGGLGMALGFIIHATFKPPAIVTFIMTATSIYLPIFLLNSFGNFYQSTGWKNPLLYFNDSNQVLTLGIPIALLFALGANGHILWQWIFGANAVTQYLSKRKAKITG